MAVPESFGGVIALKNIFFISILLFNIIFGGNAFDDGISFEEKVIATESGSEKAYVIIADPKNPELSIKPVLSFDQIFGFETLDVMAKKNLALAGINGGFFHSYGQPVGQVVIDGEWIAMPTGQNPVFVIDSLGKPHLVPVKAKAYVAVGGEKFYLDGFNRFGSSREAILYTPRYGTSTRQKPQGANIIISRGKVRDIVTGSYVQIPPETCVLYIGTDSSIKKTILGKIREGMEVKTGFDVDFPRLEPHEIKNAMEAGPFLIKEGKSVIKRWEPGIGLTTIPMARSAIGITEDEKVVLVTVEGSGPGRGISLKKLSDFLLQMGVKQAAALDGGASATMYYNGRIVNKPSGGRARPLGGGIMIIRRSDRNVEY
ncbi:MAG TPA: phosphodiester glycosidase family protein [Thermoanaerobacterales bacterium]|nr:phosphodiester glycosidase family protein [Thermoanaerobacterales bacterium]